MLWFWRDLSHLNVEDVVSTLGLLTVMWSSCVVGTSSRAYVRDILGGTRPKHNCRQRCPVNARRGDALVVEPDEIHTFVASSEDYLHFVIHAPFVQGDKVVIH
jgi:hypothetical protein